jgi:hypothetical protein
MQARKPFAVTDKTANHWNIPSRCAPASGVSDQFRVQAPSLAALELA